MTKKILPSVFLSRILIISVCGAVVFGFFTMVTEARTPLVLDVAPTSVPLVRSYRYDAIATHISVNADSTLTVEERQGYRYQGEYHQGWRSISLKGVDTITDIEVWDGATGRPFMYSSKSLDKTDPVSWGRYTTFRSNGTQNIEWYYSAKDEFHDWILKYTVHGAIAFSKKENRLYWNIFTDYSVPVDFAQVTVEFPSTIAASSVRPFAYRSDSALPIDIKTSTDGRVVFVTAQNFSGGEDFTIDIGFPAGVVAQSAYWKDYIGLNYGYVGTILLILTSFLVGIGTWWRREKLPDLHATIVPQYEPPQHLKPAMAEVISKERLTDKGLAATIIDLAVRGYIRIEEDSIHGVVEKIKKYFSGNLANQISSPAPRWIRALLRGAWMVFRFAIVLMCLLYLIFLFFIITSANSVVALAPAIVPILFLVLLWRSIVGAKGVKEYVLTRIKDDGVDLEEYEKEYLRVLFPEGKTTFSTMEMKYSTDIAKKKQFHRQIEQLKKSILQETETDTHAFEVSISREQKAFRLIIPIFFIVGFVGLRFAWRGGMASLNQFTILVMGAVFALGTLFIYLKYEARLSADGQILKNEWRGFKIFLEITGKDRLQNLTPDLFEKYLPYAIVFGVEKKWAQAFTTISVPQPAWYGAAVTSHVGAGAIASSFSPSSFSASFSSSFASAFASSGASGGGGAGGGGAGGGGGGGGGGAS